MENNIRSKGHLKLSAVFITILLSISTSSILVLLSGATAIACAFWRVSLASVILWVIRLLNSRKRSFVIDKEALIYSIVSGMVLAVHFLLWIESLFMIPIAMSTTIVVTYPLFSVLIDRFIFKENIVFPQILGLIIGLFGVFLFMHPWVVSDYNYLGVLLSFGGALGATGYFSIGRFVRKKISLDLLSYTTLTYSSTSVILLLYALIIKEDLLNYSPQTILYLVLLAVIPMIGGHTLINYILKYMKTSIATSIALCEPVGASILAYFILGQQIGRSTLLIMVIVLSSIALTISQEQKSLSS